MSWTFRCCRLKTTRVKGKKVLIISGKEKKIRTIDNEEGVTSG